LEKYKSVNSIEFRYNAIKDNIINHISHHSERKLFGLSDSSIREKITKALEVYKAEVGDIK
jgi:hypothetical protein